MTTSLDLFSLLISLSRCSTALSGKQSPKLNNNHFPRLHSIASSLRYHRDLVLPIGVSWTRWWLVSWLLEHNYYLVTVTLFCGARVDCCDYLVRPTSALTAGGTSVLVASTTSGTIPSRIHAIRPYGPHSPCAFRFTALLDVKKRYCCAYYSQQLWFLQ